MGAFLILESPTFNPIISVYGNPEALHAVYGN
jgi:hypothetical protein